MKYQRSYHTTTLLNTGMVLVAGGVGSGTSAELYDPVTGSWSTTGSMNIARFGHTATLLSSGKVLVTGGYSVTGTSVVQSTTSAEIYDPNAGSWTLVKQMGSPRAGHTATLLLDGTVLVAGGNAADSTGSNLNTYKSCEIYDPGTDSWSPTTGPMNVQRSSHTATLMPGGKVLVTGGDTYIGPISGGATPVSPTPTAELYDPGTRGWTQVVNMSIRRMQHTATLLHDGRVLIAGGQTEFNSLSSAEIFTAPTSASVVGSWSGAASMKWARKLFTATLLPSGNVLVTGGENALIIYSAAEVFDPVKGAWSDSGNMTTARSAHTAVVLQNGKVLLTGGVGVQSQLSSAELYKP